MNHFVVLNLKHYPGKGEALEEDRGRYPLTEQFTWFLTQRNRLQLDQQDKQ